MKNEPLIFGLVRLIFGGLVLLWAIRARKIRGLGSGKNRGSSTTWCSSRSG